MSRPDQIDAFLESRRAGRAMLTVPKHLWPRTVDEGYSIQAGVHALLTTYADRCIGYKIGCATTKTREPFGSDQPTYGGILRSTHRASLAAAVGDTTGPFAIECEIAVRLSRDIGPREVLTVAQAHEYIDACAVACELVQNRYGDPVAVGIPTLVADDFFHYRYVVGNWATPPDVSAFGSMLARLWIDGRIVAEDSASNVGGHPLSSVVWLASALERSDRRLRQGDVILTGAITTPLWVQSAPVSARLTVESLGGLECEL